MFSVTSHDITVFFSSSPILFGPNALLFGYDLKRTLSTCISERETHQNSIIQVNLMALKIISDYKVYNLLVQSVITKVAHTNLLQFEYIG